MLPLREVAFESQGLRLDQPPEAIEHKNMKHCSRLSLLPVVMICFSCRDITQEPSALTRIEITSNIGTFEFQGLAAGGNSIHCGLTTMPRLNLVKSTAGVRAVRKGV
jgi:hypothetical protein